MPPENQDIWSRIISIEKDLIDHQRTMNRMEDSSDELLRKIESLKDEIRSKNSYVHREFEERIHDLEEKVDEIRQEMPEMRLTRRIVFALIAFILTAVLGFVFNFNDRETIELSRDVAEKIVKEYNKAPK